MNPRFDRRSSSSARSNRSGGRKKTGRDPLSSRSSGKEDPKNENGSYRSRSVRRIGNQEREEISRNPVNRRGRFGQERGYGKENENEFSSTRSFPRRRNNQRIDPIRKKRD